MLKFKYHYLTNTLSYQENFSDTWVQVIETFEGPFSSQGFKLTEGWITFTIYQSKIRAFFKQMNSQNLTDFWEPQRITYYRKDLSKQEEIIFEFSSSDEIEKVGNSWVKKGGSQ